MLSYFSTDQVSMEGMDDMLQFMEAVTTYRCRFCEFSASTPKDMARHVRAIHITTKLNTDLVTSGEYFQFVIIQTCIDNLYNTNLL